MFFYIANVLLFFFYSLIFAYSKRIKKKTAEWIIITSGIHFGLIMALRGFNVGVDTLMYSGIYARSAAQTSIIDIINRFPKYTGFALLCKCFSFLIEDKYGYMIMSGSIVVITVWWFIYKYSLNVSLSVYLYISFFFYLSSFNISREFIAISIGLIMYHLVDKNHLGYALALLIFAVSIHSVALVLILPIIVSYLSPSRKNIILTLVISVLAILMFDKLVSVFIAYFPQYKFYDIGGLHSYNGERWKTNGGIIVFYIMYLMIGLFGAYICEKNKYDPPKINHIFRMSILVLFSGLIGIVSPRNQLISRAVFFFSIYVIILLPNLLTKFNKNTLRIVKPVLYLVMLVPLVYLLYTNNSGVVPYSLFF